MVRRRGRALEKMTMRSGEGCGLSTESFSTAYKVCALSVKELFLSVIVFLVGKRSGE
jgi:hypothetical protein